MTTKLLMEIRNIIADLASTLILGKNKDAANLAIIFVNAVALRESQRSGSSL